ncbi:conserved hypothetical protein [Aspergillus terreus NIH2624]|uniref:Uncharacterized protein n=1 Tax=Aspergillus terreus (strain NIH 2624 / FGSC A1156) TaxID=341663 RepID=Q0CRJ5_ASPTN|nr:uncharacterized protein ATEG_03689 [Aspergillus terreus NIH2624]EAU35491.1 conserved hypothetical protein [Aspergillus terreus NIH2624]
METRQARKRRTSSLSTQAPRSPAACRTTRQSAAASPASSCKTPRQPRKKVRFSDPGPQLQNGPDYSTGLTPVMLRTSFEEPADAEGTPQTPSKRLRRRSAPLPRSRVSLDPLWPARLPSPERVVQFTPLRQILDSRTQRRIRRVGLSDEINQLQREKRDTAQYEKTLQSLLRERDALRHQLELAKHNRLPQSPACSEDMPWVPPQARIENLEHENSKLREELSFSSVHSALNQSDVASTEADTIILNDSAFDGSTMLISNSPDMRGLSGHPPSIPDDMSLLDHGIPNPDVCFGRDQDADAIALSADLEAAKSEKKELFNSFRSRLSAFVGTPLESHLRQSSPPPDFLERFLPTLTEVLTRASDATSALSTVQQELRDLGFSGSNVDEIIAQMRDRFRWARLRLERAVPGETPSASLHNGNSTLSALVARVELLVQSLDEEQKMHEAAVGRERTLRGHFNAALARYETAAKKVQDLEESISSSARDMLHTRMRMQELENEGKEQAVGIDRLNAALTTYRTEVTNLETLITELEENHRQQVSQLKSQIDEEEKARHAAELSATEREARIHELEETVENNRFSVCDLTAKVELLEKERQKAVEGLEKQAMEQQQEIGVMNVRVSELTTSLEAAKSEAEKLRLSNSGLEEQLRLEIRARDSLLDRWAADQARSFAYMKETVNAERRKAKVRSANWQMKSDELQSDDVHAGSEPITPVSMTRFVDVEVGRGKHRRRLDSGIGILTDDLLAEDVEETGEIPPSDPADL